VRPYREKLRAYQERLERRPRVAFWLQVNRRFNKIEGKHLALVISINLFVAVIPLLIIIYAFAASFSANRSFGVLLARDLHLTGNSALVVRDTFSNARSGKSVALSISVISLLITGLDVSATAQVAYARAFTMTPLRGLQKYLRGAAWLLLLLADTVIVLALRNLAASRPVWFTIASGVVLLMLEFLFYLVTPRLLLELPFKWRDLVPGAAVCTGAAIIVHAVLFFFFRRWVAEYGHAYGGFGVSLALIAAIGIISSFWIWIAAVMGVYWERKAGPAVVEAMEKLSAEISAPEEEEEEATVSEKAAGLYRGRLTLQSRTPRRRYCVISRGWRWRLPPSARSGPRAGPRVIR
jgi:uncharacterized BrkB/YihY/UPF0761 family membrane protein